MFFLGDSVGFGLAPCFDFWLAIGLAFGLFCLVGFLGGFSVGVLVGFGSLVLARKVGNVSCNATSIVYFFVFIHI